MEQPLVAAGGEGLVSASVDAAAFTLAAVAGFAQLFSP